MIKSFRLVFFGVLIGVVLFYFASKRNSPTPIVQNNGQQLKVSAKKTFELNRKNPEKIEVSSAESIKATPVDALANTEPELQIEHSNQNGNEQLARHIELSLTEKDVADLEDQMPDLRYMVETRVEDRGWRIIYLTGDSLLSRAGFQEGDLITKTSLEQSTASSGDLQLANRVASILDAVSR